MVLTGQLSRAGYNTRPLVGAGFALVVIGAWLMGSMNLQISMASVVRRNILMSFGFGMIFPNTSAAALSCVGRERIGYAASLYNMLRNTGAAIGIAFMTNSLLSRQQVHQSRLVEHFSVFDAWRLHKLGAHLPGSPTFNYLPELPGGHQQLGAIYGVVQAQSAMLSFNDIYWIIAIAIIPLIPLFLLLPSSKRVGGAPAH